MDTGYRIRSGDKYTGYSGYGIRDTKWRQASILIFYEANFVARKTRAQLNQSPPNFPSIFVFSAPNAMEISFFQFHPKSGVMGQSGKVKGSMDSPYEMEATESEESEESEDRDNGNG